MKVLHLSLKDIINSFILVWINTGAGVCKFTAEVDGRVIEGVVKEKAEAKTDYDEALKSGHSAFLVEEKLPDVFKVDNCHVEYIFFWIFQ